MTAVGLSELFIDTRLVAVGEKVIEDVEQIDPVVLIDAVVSLDDVINALTVWAHTGDDDRVNSVATTARR